jgi:hypothetical protein
MLFIYFRVAISLIVATVFLFVIDGEPDSGTVTDTPIALDPDQPLLQVSFPIRGKF